MTSDKPTVALPVAVAPGGGDDVPSRPAPT